MNVKNWNGHIVCNWWFIQKCGVSLAGYMGKAWSRVEGLNCLKFTHIFKRVIKRLNIYANSMPNVNSI